MNSKEHNKFMEVIKIQNEVLLKLDMEKCELKDELRDKNVLVKELQNEVINVRCLCYEKTVEIQALKDELKKKNKKKKIIKKKDNIDWTGGLDFE
jgi:hypothetical protein